MKDIKLLLNATPDKHIKFFSCFCRNNLNTIVALWKIENIEFIDFELDKNDIFMQFKGYVNGEKYERMDIYLLDGWLKHMDEGYRTFVRFFFEKKFLPPIIWDTEIQFEYVDQLIKEIYAY